MNGCGLVQQALVLWAWLREWAWLLWVMDTTMGMAGHARAIGMGMALGGRCCCGLAELWEWAWPVAGLGVGLAD